MSGGVLVRVVFVQMVFVRGGFCPTARSDDPHTRPLKFTWLEATSPKYLL